MFDIGFAELIIIGVVALLVIGPERLPGAIRTGSVYLGKLRRGFNDIKQEVQQELHNDGIMNDLRTTSQALQQETQVLGEEIKNSAEQLVESTKRAHEDIQRELSEPPSKTTPIEESASDPVSEHLLDSASGDKTTASVSDGSDKN